MNAQKLLRLAYEIGPTSGTREPSGVVAETFNDRGLGLIIDRTDITRPEIRDAIDPEWIEALSNAETIRWWLAGDGPFHINARNKLQLTGAMMCVEGFSPRIDITKSIWSPPHAKQASNSLLSVIHRPASRAEILFGPGETVSEGEIARAENIRTAQEWLSDHNGPDELTISDEYFSFLSGVMHELGQRLPSTIEGNNVVPRPVLAKDIPTLKKTAAECGVEMAFGTIRDPERFVNFKPMPRADFDKLCAVVPLKLWYLHKPTHRIRLADLQRLNSDGH